MDLSLVSRRSTVLDKTIFYANFQDRQKGGVFVFKAEILDKSAVERSLIRMAHEIIEKNNGAEGLMLIGIYRRGVPLAKRLAANIERSEGVKVPIGMLDITHYRDDLTMISDEPMSKKPEFPESPQGKTVVLVDDVLYTGRTARAAMEAVMKAGRPAAIRLAVLVDRGHRELPIRGDFVGKNLPTSKTEVVKVCIDEYDSKTCVELHDTK